MDADQLDLKITGHVVTPGRVLEDGWIGVRLAMPATTRTRWPRSPRVGMLFAPSRDGRSHCPEEWTEPDDIAVCLAALAAAVIRLDKELEP